jgi:hypothetical protein
LIGERPEQKPICSGRVAATLQKWRTTGQVAQWRFDSAGAGEPSFGLVGYLPANQGIEPANPCSMPSAIQRWPPRPRTARPDLNTNELWQFATGYNPSEAMRNARLAPLG